MYKIGIDVGSTYTKYCIVCNDQILDLHTEKTPLRQKQYFSSVVEEYRRKYPDSRIVSCGYGKKNVDSVTDINELAALAKGAFYITGGDGVVLDIGGQDTKIISQQNGRIKGFFINDQCAAGSGMFLTNVLERVGKKFEEISLIGVQEPDIHLSSVCAVFAQSEIVGLIADNRTEDQIVNAVLWQIVSKAKALINKVETQSIMISGGLSRIPGIDLYAEKILNRECFVTECGSYLSAIGCAIN